MERRRKTIQAVLAIAFMILCLAGCAEGSGGETKNIIDESDEEGNRAEIRVGSLKGPTSMGILFLMEKADRGETEDSYSFRIATGADELLALMAKGELDIAMIPANAAAVLYGKTEGGIAVLDINTLGVLYLVTGAEGIDSMSDLQGRKIYLTGKGMTPEASFRYLMKESGQPEETYTLEFRSEPAEVAAVLASDPEAVGLLPQPFATAAVMKNESLRLAVDLDEAWREADAASGGMVTGVTVVSRAFLEEHPEAVERFLTEHGLSAAALAEDLETGAVLAVQAGIVGEESAARTAIPQCGIACVTGQEMKKTLSAYLRILEEFDAELIGGQMPGEDFYYDGL